MGWFASSAVVKSPAMTGYRTGAATRRAILLALLEREPRTVRGLAAAVGISYPAMRAHLLRMARDGAVVIQTGRRGSPGQVTLTEAGRTAARLV